mgnify:FL=1
MLTQKMMPGSEFTTVYPVLYPPYADRAAWAALPGAARWKAAGDAALQDADTLPRLPLSLWLRFTQNGDRTAWEHAYFARRRTLCALAMAEAVTGAGSYLPAIADLAWAICEESAWQLPAHNSYIRDTPQLPLPDVTRPIVDLFAAETGALIATVYGLLGAALDGYAPGFSVRLKGEVERRVLAPYRTAHFWWMGNGEEPMCNWTPWCTQNMLLAAAQCAPAETLPVYVKQAAYSIDCFLKDYGEDGCCSEGAQYYRHAALTMFNALDLLCRIAPGVFDDVWAEPKIRNMAEYIVNMHIAGPYYLNFADCSPLAGARGVREFLFGQRVASAPLMTLAARDWADALQQPDPDRLHHPDDSEGINLYYHIQTALAEQKVLAFAQSAAPALPRDVWYPSVGILTCRRGAYALGAKAGNNADSHNHNDVGSVTLYKNGAPLLIDVGVETYSKKTFSPQRYEIWTMQSSWHNLPEFEPEGAGYQQQPGAEFAARDVAVSDALDAITMDIAPAYGAVPGLGFYRRRVQLNENGLTLQDETDFSRTVALTLMSVEKPAVEGGTVQFGTLAAAHVDGAQRIMTESVPITDPRLRQAWPDTLYRTRICFTGALTVEVQ